jgi:hypothetical protein
MTEDDRRFPVPAWAGQSARLRRLSLEAGWDPSVIESPPFNLLGAVYGPSPWKSGEGRAPEQPL